MTGPPNSANAYYENKKQQDIIDDLLAALEQASTAFESACAYVENVETRKFLLSNAEITRAAIAKAHGE